MRSRGDRNSIVKEVELKKETRYLDANKVLKNYSFDFAQLN
jgi:hypothetical protein